MVSGFRLLSETRKMRPFSVSNGASRTLILTQSFSHYKGFFKLYTPFTPLLGTVRAVRRLAPKPYTLLNACAEMSENLR